MKKAIVLLTLALSGCNDFFENHALAQCEEAIKSQLVAPASYKRVSVDGTELNMNNGIWTITYDAVNTYNAPLRKSGSCEITHGKVIYRSLS